MKTLAERTVGELVAERFDQPRVFDRYGIDYCCGGKQTLERACRARGLALADVEEALREAADHPRVDGVDWRSKPLGDLIHNILDLHHVFLREELPRLGAMLDRVVAKHGAEHAWLVELRQVYVGLWDELFDHMRKEELVLFPYVQRLEAAASAGQAAPAFPCGTVLQPIAVMEAEHQSAGEALAKMRLLTNGYQAPEDACTTWRALWHGLEALERDLHLHIHKENNLLFPRALELEQRYVPRVVCRSMA